MFGPAEARFYSRRAATLYRAVGVFECESVVRRASIVVLVSRGLVPSYPRRSALITHTTTTGREYRDAGPCHANLAVPLLFFFGSAATPSAQSLGVPSIDICIQARAYKLVARTRVDLGKANPQHPEVCRISPRGGGWG